MSPAKISVILSSRTTRAAPHAVRRPTVRSPHPHARIVAYPHPRRVGRLRGAVTILTAVTTSRATGSSVTSRLTSRCSCSTASRYQGEPIAFVVATSQRLAWRRAADAVTVEYSPLPVLTDPEAALDPRPQPLLHPDGNLVRRLVYSMMGASATAPRWRFLPGRGGQGVRTRPSSAPRADSPGPTPTATTAPITQDLHLSPGPDRGRAGIHMLLVRVVLWRVGGAFRRPRTSTCQIHLAARCADWADP